MRKNSQGIPNKNTKEFINKPLMAHTIEQALESGVFSDVVVSTDYQEYAEVAIQYGATVPFLRPEHLATHDVPSSEVTLHTLQELKKQKKEYTNFAVLQVTSPLRTAEDICNAYNMLTEKQADMIISVCLASTSPLWMNTLSSDLSMKDFISKEVRNLPRQKIDYYYTIHGAIFFAKVDAYLKNKDPYTQNTFAYIMPQERSIDIDTIVDFRLAEILYRK